MKKQVNPREALLRLEKWTPQEKATYQQEISKMILTPLTPTGKAIAAVGCTLGLVAGIALAALFFQEDVPALTSVALGLMSVGGFSIAGYCASILWKGGKSLVRHGLWLALHLASLSTLFLALALVKIAIVPEPGLGLKIAAVAACVQWVFLAVLPIVSWKTRMSQLERRQAELLAQVEAGEPSPAS